MRAYKIALAEAFGERFAATQTLCERGLVSYMPLASEGAGTLSLPVLPQSAIGRVNVALL